MVRKKYFKVMTKKDPDTVSDYREKAVSRYELLCCTGSLATQAIAGTR